MKKITTLLALTLALVGLSTPQWARGFTITDGSASIVVPAGGFVGLADLFGADSPQWFFLRNGSASGVICCSNDPFVAPKIDAAGSCNMAEAFFPHQSGQLLPASLAQQAICTANVPSVLYGEAAQ